MPSKGSRFTFGDWGLRCVRSTLRLCSQPSATIRNRFAVIRSLWWSGVRVSQPYLQNYAFWSNFLRLLHYNSRFTCAIYFLVWQVRYFRAALTFQPGSCRAASAALETYASLFSWQVLMLWRTGVDVLLLLALDCVREESKDAANSETFAVF